MLKIDELKTEAEAFRKDAELELVRKALVAALDVVDRKIDSTPLTPRQIEKEQKRQEKEKLSKLVGCLLTLAALIGSAAAIFDFAKEKNRKEEQKKAEAQKELYRKLSSIKGR